MRLFSYENAKLYKEKTKRWHDKNIQARVFEKGQKVLLFNSRLKLFPGNLKSRWSGPFTVIQVYPFGAVEVRDDQSGREFKVNGHRLKHYWGGEVDREKTSVTLEDPWGWVYVGLSSDSSINSRTTQNEENVTYISYVVKKMKKKAEEKEKYIYSSLI